MGIADRDYARPQPQRQPSALVRARALSATAWIIIVCVGVFVFDQFAPNSWMRPVYQGDKVVVGAFDRAHAVFAAAPKPPPPQARNKVSRVAITDSRNGALVGERSFTWMAPLEAVGHFSTFKGFLSLEVWRLVTFQFLHANHWHLLMNMVGLFFFGPLVEQALRSRKRFLSFYLVCGVFGALTYLLLNLIGNLVGPDIAGRVPGLLINEITTPLVGASAGIFGILMAAAFVAGNGTMYVFGVIPMRISTGAYLFAAISLINLLTGGQNAGGDAAHIGGAIAGFFFIRRMHLLRDFLDVLGADGSSRKPSSRKDRDKLDAILDKVNTGGLQALSEQEKEFLRRETQERQRRSGG